jgi:transcription elongation factor GreA
MGDKYYVSEERLAELKTELETLKTKTRLDIADALKRAKEYGDLSENAEYAQAREEQTRVETRIFELEEFVKKAVVIKGTVGGDTVRVGSRVTLQRDGKESTYAIVGSSEANPQEGKISNESPIGKAFLGKKIGDSVEVTTPAGTATYQVTKIE